LRRRHGLRRRERDRKRADQSDAKHANYHGRHCSLLTVTDTSLTPPDIGTAEEGWQNTSHDSHVSVCRKQIFKQRGPRVAVANVLDRHEEYSLVRAVRFG
jgi:hypothetical protein